MFVYKQSFLLLNCIVAHNMPLPSCLNNQLFNQVTMFTRVTKKYPILSSLNLLNQFNQPKSGFNRANKTGSHPNCHLLLTRLPVSKVWDKLKTQPTSFTLPLLLVTVHVREKVEPANTGSGTSATSTLTPCPFTAGIYSNHGTSW